ncbi:MAG: hypothetical protein NZM07_09815 [Elioraea sp.]|nr:hypothetical protein [Elioraea sp.]
MTFATPAPRPVSARTAVVVAADAIAPRGDPLVRRLASSRHGAACACCRPRAALAEALHRLFLDRARGAVPWFDRVELRLAVDAETLAAFADPLVAARFRLEPPRADVGQAPAEGGLRGGRQSV